MDVHFNDLLYNNYLCISIQIHDFNVQIVILLLVTFTLLIYIGFITTDITLLKYLMCYFLMKFHLK